MTRPWFRPLLEATAAKYDLDPNVVEAITFQESSYRPSAFRFEPMFYARYIKDNPRFNRMEPVRVASSYGLMQVMYTTAVDFGFTQEPEYLFIVDINLEFGCKFFADLYAWAGHDTKKALQAYNGGKGAWDRPMARAYGSAVWDLVQKVDRREGRV